MPQPKIDFAIGGQALIEGVMMRAPHGYAIAVRTPSGRIVVKTEQFVGIGERFRVFRLPVIRGIIGFFEMMVVGIKALNYSARVSMGDVEKTSHNKGTSEKHLFYCNLHASAPNGSSLLAVSSSDTPSSRVRRFRSKRANFVTKICFSEVPKAFFENFFVGLALIFSLAFGIFLFKFLPLTITEFFSNVFPVLSQNYFFFNIIDGFIKILFFSVYIGLIGLMPDIARVFQYHGAEHKSVFAYERRVSLDVKHAKTQSRFHPRCGTSFILVIFLFSIFLYTLMPNHPIFFIKFAERIAVLPIIAGISYEILKLSARYQKSLFARIFSYPGLLLQRFTTKEPDEKQLEVALKALKSALEMEKRRS